MAEEQELTEEQKKEGSSLVFKLKSILKKYWDTIRAKLEANAELKESVLRKDLNVEDYAKRMVELKIEEDKDDKPTKKTGKRRKHIARKGFHTDHDKDESEDSDEANEKDDSTSGTKIPINPVPVATKSPSIANYKIIKQGRKGVYQIVRENGTDMVYISFGAMLTDISRDDLTELYRIVMKKHGMNEPEDEFEKVLWEYLKNMFEEPPYTYSIWSLPGCGGSDGGSGCFVDDELRMWVSAVEVVDSWGNGARQVECEGVVDERYSDSGDGGVTSEGFVPTAEESCRLVVLCG
ncbi:hypothetical protein Tco_0114828 [Tanacetum coccineum]